MEVRVRAHMDGCDGLPGAEPVDVHSFAGDGRVGDTEVVARVNVTACLVTRGDVDMQPILDSLPDEWERVIWNNAIPTVHHFKDANDWRPDGAHYSVSDLSVYGRYAAIQSASHDLIYVQDDDAIVSDPQAIVEAMYDDSGDYDEPYTHEVICNMPPEFRHDFYRDHSLVGFGAVFHRDAPKRAFDRFFDYSDDVPLQSEFFRRTCDIVFTGLTPCVRVDVPKTNLPCAEADNRMYRQTAHVGERTRMLELVRQVRDA